jgi:hypothetical protein
MSRPTNKRALSDDERKLVTSFDTYLNSLIEERMRSNGGSGQELDLSDNFLLLFGKIPPLEIRMEIGGDLEELTQQDNREENKPKKEFLATYQDSNELKDRPTIERALTGVTKTIISLARGSMEFEKPDHDLVLGLLQKTFRYNPVLKSRLGDSKDYDLNGYIKSIDIGGPVFPLTLLDDIKLVKLTLEANPELINDAFEPARRNYLSSQGDEILAQGTTLFQRHLRHSLVNGDTPAILEFFLENLKNSELLGSKGGVVYGDEQIEETIIDSIIHMPEEKDELRNSLINILKSNHLEFVAQYRSSANNGFVTRELDKILAPSSQVNPSDAQALEVKYQARG